MLEINLEHLSSELKKHGQQHLLQFWELLTDDHKYILYNDLKNIDYNDVMDTFNQSIKAGSAHSEINDDLLEPLDNSIHDGVVTCDWKRLKLYREEGLRQISEGKVAVLLLAGGQGTRLGVNYPKGMYNVGLPSNKTLFQLQGERILRIEKLAADMYHQYNPITWYIMTSEETKIPTEEFFNKNNYFGLSKDNIVLFEQGTMPCFSDDGRIILEKMHCVARSPDGNGGLYQALLANKILDDMEERGISYIHVYCVDNILVKLADPAFIGYCVLKEAEAAAKVVEKNVSTEAVGIICKVNGRFKVVEYSEVSSNIATKRDLDGRLTFRWGSICNHFFTLDFLKRVSNKKLAHHIAKKKIPYVDPHGNLNFPDKPNGIKLEKYVFDVFEYARKFAVWEVLREEEFAPLKNNDVGTSDTPTTCRKAVYDLHKNYIIKAGGSFEDKDVICEISPLLSYEGEDLREMVKDKRFTSPLLLERINI